MSNKNFENVNNFVNSKGYRCCSECASKNDKHTSPIKNTAIFSEVSLIPIRTTVIAIKSPNNDSAFIIVPNINSEFYRMRELILY